MGVFRGLRCADGRFQAGARVIQITPQGRCHRERAMRTTLGLGIGMREQSPCQGLGFLECTES